MNQPERLRIITHDCGNTTRIADSELYGNCKCPACKKWFTPGDFLRHDPKSSAPPPPPHPGATFFICSNPHCGWRGFAAPIRPMGYSLAVVAFMFLFGLEILFLAAGGGVLALIILVGTIALFVADVARIIVNNLGPRCVCPQCHGRLQ